MKPILLRACGCIFVLALGGPFCRATVGPGAMESVLGIQGEGVVQAGGVEPGSLAEGAGMKPGDLLVAFNGRRVRDFADYRAFLEALRAAVSSSAVTLDLLRYDAAVDSFTPRTLTLELPNRPADPGQVRIGLRCDFTYLVTQVSGSGFGARLGLTPGDFIEQINGQRGFESLTAMDTLLAGITSGPVREVTLWVTRWKSVENGRARGSQTRTLRGAP